MIEHFLIGTYTKKTSKGAYQVTLDTDKHALTNVQLIIPSEKPAYLQSGKNDIVYAIKQIGEQGGVASYSLKDGQSQLLSKVLTVGAPPAYVGLDEKRHLLFSANYHTCKIDVFRIDNEGKLTLADSVTDQGVPGPQPEQKDGAHPHFADLTPDGRLVTCDLGLDLIVVYDISDEGKLTAVSRYKSEAGFGTRHITFGKDGKFAYCVGELSSKLEVLRYNAANGSFTHVQTLKTIPSTWTAHNGAAAIRMSKDGKFVYVSNRGENTIAVFAVQPNGTVTHIQSISTEGDFPRDFNLDVDDSYLLASNQNSDNLTLYSRDAETGRLTLLQKDVKCPEPVCVQLRNE